MWRIIPIESQDDSYMKMAKEEAIMASVRDGKFPATLRFYSWNSPAVALGYFQQAEKELNLDLCRQDNIEVFRRLTGGGAVYKSPANELNYSFIIREDEDYIPKDVEESYRLICSALIEGFRMLGVDAMFKPVNDILLNGKKISGNAQTRVDNVILHHGTILLKPEHENMFRYLKIDDKKLLEKKVSDVKDLVTGICMKKTFTKIQIQNAIIEGFEKVFDKSFKESQLTDDEECFAREKYNKYADNKFIHWR